MLFLLAAWTILLLISLPLGTAILKIVKADVERRGDRFILAVWLGIFTLANVLLAVSLLLPLSPWVGAGVAIAFLSLTLRSRNFTYSLSRLTPVWVFVAAVSALAISAFVGSIVNHYDTGLYHFQVIRWLSRYGTVPGLALLHERFGFVSAWFALVAPFNFGFFEARICTLANGFIFLLAILHLAIAFARLWRQQEALEDRFAIVAYLLCLPLLASKRIPISTATDLPIILATIVISWSILLISAQKNELQANSWLDIRIVPLLLATGAVAIKLSALPLLLVGFFFYLEKNPTIARLLFGGAIAFLLLLPMLGFSFITSGCLLFPSSFACFNLPWGVGKENADAMAQVIADWGRWYGSQPKNSTANDWFGYWLGFRTSKQVILLIIASLVAAVGLAIRSQRDRLGGLNYILVAGVFGIALMMYSSPDLRFGLGYLVIIPALYLSVFLEKAIALFSLSLLLAGLIWLEKSQTLAFALVAGFFFVYLMLLLPPFKNRRKRAIVPKILLSIFLLLLATIPLKYSLLNPSHPQSVIGAKNLSYLLLPPQLQMPPKITQKQINDVKFSRPVGQFPSQRPEDRCWAAELPCSPGVKYKIQLRDPKKDLAGGFIRDRQ
jgi:hypothetical protein